MKTLPEINHAKLFHTELCWLTKFTEYYNSNLNSIREEYNYILEGGSSIFTKKTIETFRSFLKNLISYEKSNKFKDDPLLRLLDDNYVELIKGYLMPLIHSVEEDLKSSNISIDPCGTLEI